MQSREIEKAQLDALAASPGAAKWVLRPPKPSPEALRGVPPFPGVEARALVESASMGASPLAVAWFSTPMSVEGVLAYYQEYYRLLSRKTVHHLYSPTSGYVAWLETDARNSPGRGVLHMVSALRQGNETVVFLSANDPLALASGPTSPLPAGVVAPPDATPPRVLSQRDEGRTMETISLSVPRTNPETVIAFYRQYFVRAGWSLQDIEELDGVRLVSAASGTAQQTVMASRSASGDVDVVISHEVRW